jgi:hypothetical protein
MVKLALYGLVCFSVSSCIPSRKSLYGSYKSTCFIQAHPNVVLRITADSSFEYNFAYLNEKINGKWNLKSDTLYLYSDAFSRVENIGLSPRRKHTHLPDFDAYLVKGKKLFILSRDQVEEKNCYLIKQ